MSIIHDPSMKEIVIGFCDEADALFDELQISLEILEDIPANTKELEKFGQIIDRIMGAAKSLALNDIAIFCELGKIIGYKSSQIRDIPLIEVVVAILFDTLDLLRKMVKSLRDGNDGLMKNLNTKAFTTRLNWLSAKFKDIDRASVALEGNMDQNSIDELMQSLGL